MYHDINEKCRYLYPIEQTSREKVVLFFSDSRHVAVFDALMKRTEFPQAAKSQACDLISKTH